MSMYNDIVWRQEGIVRRRVANSQIVADYAKRFAHGHWSFLGPGSEKKWCGTYNYKPNAEWDRVAADMMLNFGESGRPVFPVLWKEELYEAKKDEICLFISAVTKIHPKWFFAQSFPSISSVSTEQ